jgi:hypothetical protein
MNTANDGGDDDDDNGDSNNNVITLRDEIRIIADDRCTLTRALSSLDSSAIHTSSFTNDIRVLGRGKKASR